MINKKIIYIGITIIVFYVLIVISPEIFNFLYLIFNFIKPILISFFIAYLLNELSYKISKNKINIVIIKSALTIFIIMSFIYLMFLGIPKILSQINKFMLNKDILILNFDNIINNILFKFKIRSSISTEILFEKLLIFINNNINNIFIFIKNIVYIPVLTIYFLFDFEKIERLIKKVLKYKNKHKLYCLIKDSKLIINNYVKSLFIVIVFLIVFSFVCFKIIGLKYALLFSIIIGITDIIPIIGPYLGGFIVLLYTLTISVDLFIKVLILIIIIQLIESNVLTPIIQSKNMKLPSVLIMISFLFFSKILGFFGMIISTPLISIVMLYINKYKDNIDIKLENISQDF